MVALKVVVFVLSLGIDTLIMSVSLGLAKVEGRLRIALSFATAEAVMPLIGLLIGKGAGQLIGDYAGAGGGVLLIGLAIWLIFFEDDDGEDGDDDDGHRIRGKLTGLALVGTAISVSLDELAVGFSIGLVGVPVLLTVILIALQAFGFTLLGLTFGSKWKPYLGDWAEKIAGVVLGLLGLWITINGIILLFHRA